MNNKEIKPRKDKTIKEENKKRKFIFKNKARIRKKLRTAVQAKRNQQQKKK